MGISLHIVCMITVPSIWIHMTRSPPSSPSPSLYPPSPSLPLPFSDPAPSLLRLERRVGLSRQGSVSRDQLQSREYCLQQGWLLPSLCWNCTTTRQLGILFSNIVLKWIWISHTMTAHSQPFNLTLLLSEIQSGIHYIPYNLVLHIVVVTVL